MATQVDNAMNTSLGLDMCQSCIEYQAKVQDSDNLIRKLVQNHLSHARRLANMCMEGSLLLRLSSKKADKKQQHVSAKEVEVSKSRSSVQSRRQKSLDVPENMEKDK